MKTKMLAICVMMWFSCNQSPVQVDPGQDPVFSLHYSNFMFQDIVKGIQIHAAVDVDVSLDSIRVTLPGLVSVYRVKCPGGWSYRTNQPIPCQTPGAIYVKEIGIWRLDFWGNTSQGNFHEAKLLNVE